MNHDQCMTKFNYYVESNVGCLNNTTHNQIIYQVGSEIYAHIVYTLRYVLKQTHTRANTIK
jgi:hypothetical protein